VVDGSAWWVPSGTATLLLLGLLAYVARNRPPRKLTAPLAAVLAGALLFSAGDLGSHFATSREADWLALLVLYAGHTLLIPGCWFLALRFAHVQKSAPSWAKRWWARLPAPWFALLWLALVANPWHGRFLTANVGTRSDYHELWYVFAVSGYGLVAASLCLFALLAWRAPNKATRRQAIMMVLATAFTGVGNLVYVTSPVPPPFDPTALGLCLTSTLFLIGVYRGQLFTLSPIALTELARQDSDGVVVVDGDGRLLFANPAAERWLGAEALPTGEPMLARLAARLRLAADLRADAAASPIGTHTLEQSVLGHPQPQGGHLFRAIPSDDWVRLEATPIRDRSGRVACHAIRLRDETTIHELIAAAADQASTLTAVMRASDEGILVQLDGAVRWSNQQFHDIWQTPAELRDTRSPDALVEAYLPLIADRERFLERAQEVARNPSVALRRDLDLADGRTLEHAGMPLRRGAEVVGRVWRVRDVTEQRRAEETIRRTQKLESLGVMAGGIAHDFNNLLVTVLGNASLAQAELPADSPARERVADIERAAERASELTRQLLTYAGRGRLEVAPVDLSRLVSDVADLMSVSISKRVTVQLALAPEPPAVTGDASQLRQLVMNLLLNAADAIGEEEGIVDLSVQVLPFAAEELDEFAGDGAPAPGRWLVLRVADTGCGMDEEVRARIFDPFFSTKFTGRGLGLAASLGVVRSHGGFVRVRSEAGRGSEFTVLLPPGAAPAPPRKPAENADAHWRSNATVLVVDDDANVSRVAERMLASAGLEVLTAAEGSEALEIWRERGGVDLVLLDLHMPGLSGEATCRALRELDPDALVLFTSGYPEQEASDLLVDARHSAFIQKPYRTEQLLAKVRALLE
jgi:signal transduction histidine kinase